MPAQSHQSDPRILGRRTLQRDHRCLATLLRPDIAVLDIGCGTGAITSGIARAVGTQGHVVGVDRDAGLSELARREHGTLTNLHFENGDATNLNFRSQFDIVTAAFSITTTCETNGSLIPQQSSRFSIEHFSGGGRRTTGTTRWGTVFRNCFGLLGSSMSKVTSKMKSSDVGNQSSLSERLCGLR